MCVLSDGNNCVRGTAKFAECWQILILERAPSATPEGKDDPSAGKVLQSSLAVHPGEDNVCYMFKKPRSWGKKLGLAMFSAPNTELPS
jgi:hypothetical protein